MRGLSNALGLTVVWLFLGAVLRAEDPGPAGGDGGQSSTQTSLEDALLALAERQGIQIILEAATKKLQAPARAQSPDETWLGALARLLSAADLQARLDKDGVLCVFGPPESASTVKGQTRADIEQRSVRGQSLRQACRAAQELEVNYILDVAADDPDFRLSGNLIDLTGLAALARAAGLGPTMEQGILVIRRADFTPQELAAYDSQFWEDSQPKKVEVSLGRRGSSLLESLYTVCLIAQVPLDVSDGTVVVHVVTPEVAEFDTQLVDTIQATPGVVDRLKGLVEVHFKDQPWLDAVRALAKVGHMLPTYDGKRVLVQPMPAIGKR